MSERDAERGGGFRGLPSIPAPPLFRGGTRAGLGARPRPRATDEIVEPAAEGGAGLATVRGAVNVYGDCSMACHVHMCTGFGCFK